MSQHFVESEASVSKMKSIISKLEGRIALSYISDMHVSSGRRVPVFRLELQSEQSAIAVAWHSEVVQPKLPSGSNFFGWPFAWFLQTPELAKAT